MSDKRVVITGIGLVTPIGTGADLFWKAATESTNGIAAITSFDTSDFRTKVGGEVKDFCAENYLASEAIVHMGKSSQYAVAAALMAVEDSGIDFTKMNPGRIGVSMGTTMGEPQVLEQCIQTVYRTSDAHAVPAGLPRQYPCNTICANVARHFDLRGPVIIIPTACAAGNYAIGYGADLIWLDQAECVLCGGSDPFSRIAFTGFNRLLATAAQACRPFSLNRDGMAVAEGAGFIVLEELERALKRGAPVYAEILGYGLSCDAYSMTIPSPAGEGGIRALKRALDNSHVDARDIDYICAHGTGTKENDKIETFLVKQVLGDHARNVPMSSLKSMIGHTMGAASAIEAAASALMIKHGVLLPTINYDEPDPECDMDYVPNCAREKKICTVVSNAYAFGGNTSSLVLRRYEG